MRILLSSAWCFRFVSETSILHCCTSYPRAIHAVVRPATKINKTITGTGLLNKPREADLTETVFSSFFRASSFACSRRFRIS